VTWGRRRGGERCGCLCGVVKRCSSARYRAPWVWCLHPTAFGMIGNGARRTGRGSVQPSGRCRRGCRDGPVVGEPAVRGAARHRGRAGSSVCRPCRAACLRDRRRPGAGGGIAPMYAPPEHPAGLTGETGLFTLSAGCDHDVARAAVFGGAEGRSSCSENPASSSMVGFRCLSRADQEELP
jgi:hypothetical protein